MDAHTAPEAFSIKTKALVSVAPHQDYFHFLNSQADIKASTRHVYELLTQRNTIVY